MRILRVRLKNYRGVDDCTVEFPATGVTVIEGDNEVGKTSIPEAFDLILSELDSSSKKAVRAIRPVHRDAGPEVEVEICSGHYRFTYFKRWHRKPETTLEITAPRREQLTGREAHERVEAMLAETLDHQLWKAMTVEQGAEPGLPKLGVPSLGRALDLAAEGTKTAGDDDALWERIAAERLRYWTATGRESQERRALADDVEQVQKEIEDLNAQMQAIEENAVEAARLAGQEGALAARCNDAAAAAAILNDQWEATKSLREQIERLTAVHEAAQTQYRAIEVDGQRRRELIDAVKNEHQALAALETEVQRAAPGLALAVRHSEEANTALDKARNARRVAQDKLRLAVEDRDYRRNEIEKDQFHERNERVLAARQSLRAAEAVLDSSEVGDDLVGQIEQAGLEMTRAEAAFETSAATVEATALSAQSVLINDQMVAMSAGDVQRAHVTGDWELVVPDAFKVRVLAGYESKDLAADLEAAREEHARLCARGGVSNLAEARQRADERRDAERSRAEAIRAIEENLRDLTPEGLAQKLEGLAKRVASYPAGRPQAPPLPEDFDQAKKVVSDAEAEAEERQSEVERCEAIAETAAEAKRAAETDAKVQALKLENARDALRRAEQKLQEARRERSDLDLDGALGARQAEVRKAATALGHAEGELRAHDPETLRAKLDNAQRVKTRAESELKDNQVCQRDLRVTLEAKGEAGLHTRLNDARSRHQQLSGQKDRTEERAQAALLLYQTFERRRLEARQRYIAPFKDHIEQLGRIVFGSTFEVELDGDLRASKRTLNGITLDVEQLSVGAREQLGVICRLAGAALVSPDGGGAPVVVDDALGWSDPSRLQSMGAAIAFAGRQCQVIVLTCTPDRYAHVGNAQVVRLPTTG